MRMTHRHSSRVICCRVALGVVCGHPLCSCPVCLAEFEEGDVLLQLPCRHAFHAECIESWLKRHVTCPTCRCLLQPPREDSQHRPAGALGQGHQQLAGTTGVEGSRPSELARQGTPGQEEVQRDPQTSVDIQDQGSITGVPSPQAHTRSARLLATAWHQLVGQRRRNGQNAPTHHPGQSSTDSVLEDRSALPMQLRQSA